MERGIFEEEHEIFRDSVRRFAEKEIAPHVEAWHEAGIVNTAAWACPTSASSRSSSRS